jgi:hypothetical protein
MKNLKYSLILVFFSLICAPFTHSQVLISLLLGDKLNSDKLEFGLDGGANLTRISNLEETKYLPDFHLGFYFDFKLQPKLFIHTGVIVKSTMGARGITPYSVGNEDLDSLLIDSEVFRKLQYWNVPALVRYRFYDYFHVEGGIQLGLLYKATDRFEEKIYDKKDLKFKYNIFKENDENKYKYIDVGAVGGIGYKLKKGDGMTLGVRYYYGFMDIVKDNSGPAQHNTSLYFCVSIPIGKGKAEAKHAEENE